MKLTKIKVRKDIILCYKCETVNYAALLENLSITGLIKINYRKGANLFFSLPKLPINFVSRIIYCKLVAKSEISFF